MRIPELDEPKPRDGIFTRVKTKQIPANAWVWWKV